jgi:hypothetical protein
LYLRSKRQASAKVDYAALALQTAEGDKGQVFNKLWGVRFSEASRRSLPTDIREKESELQSRKSKLSTELQDVLTAEGTSQRPAAQIRSELVRVGGELDAFIRLLTQSEQSIRRIVRNDALPVPLEVREVPLLEGELLVECRIAEDARYVWLVARGDDGHSRIFQFYSILRGREWFRAQVRTIKRGISEAQLGGFDPKLSKSSRRNGE